MKPNGYSYSNYIANFFIFISQFLRHNPIFKDVYREVGILEVFVGCLVKYYGFLQKHVDEGESQSFEIELTVNEDEIGNGNWSDQNHS